MSEQLNSSLPSQKVTKSQRTDSWKKSCVDYFINFRNSNGSDLRSDRNNKITNYNLANGKCDIEEIRKICDPNGDYSGIFSDSFIHHDKISPIIHELLGEEEIKPDSTIVYAETSEYITSKASKLKERLLNSIKSIVEGQMDPNTVDPNNPPETPEEILKIEKMSPSDMLESKSNKLLKILKNKTNCKLLLSEGFKDVLIAGEEIYWVGITNGEPDMRRCNPLNMTVILDDSDQFIDDAIAVIEERLLTVPSIIDEYGDKLTKREIEELEKYSRSGYIGNVPTFLSNGNTIMEGLQPTSSMTNPSNNFAIKVIRVEWIGMKQVGFLSYNDMMNGQMVEKLVDEDFNFKEFKQINPTAEIEWTWINDAWEGTKIGNIYVDIKSKENQRRRMDNPYYTKLGYGGFIYEAVNAKSVSVIDRIKSYQYLFNIIAWKLQLVFGSDMGKVLLMDMAQIPNSQGIDTEKWIHYLKEMKIAFINSFEEGKKGAATGKLAGQHFNQFQSIDLSLSQSVQQYINYLQFIDQQIYHVSGVNPQRLGNIHQDEAVKNVQQATSQSQTVTQYLYSAHQEVKRRIYESLIEVAKITYRDGMVTQYVNDDQTLEMLNLKEFEFENIDFGVFVSNLDKDKLVKSKLDQLVNIAMEQQKIDLSDIIDTVLNDSPKDIINILKTKEEQFYANQKSQQEQMMKVENDKIKSLEKIKELEILEKQKDREMTQYKIDQDNATKIYVAEINTYIGQKDSDKDNNGIPDPIEIGNLALKQQDIASKAQMEREKLSHTKDLKNKELEIKQKEIASKENLEKLKIKQTEVQNKSQERIANEANKIKKEEMKNKIVVEKLKIKAKPRPTIKK